MVAGAAGSVAGAAGSGAAGSGAIVGSAGSVAAGAAGSGAAGVAGSVAAGGVGGGGGAGSSPRMNHQIARTTTTAAMIQYQVRVIFPSGSSPVRRRHVKGNALARRAWQGQCPGRGTNGGNRAEIRAVGRPRSSLSPVSTLLYRAVRGLAPVFCPVNVQKDGNAIARRPHNAPPTRDTGPRVNERIRAPEIRLIGADGENIGVITPDRAMSLAEEAGLDLVEISPNATPPVAKIMDFGKYKYETQKKESEARKKQKIIEIKEIKFRPNTDTHDYEVKMRSVVKFLEGGDKVKVTLRFRGREMAHAELGRKLLERVADDVTELGKIEAMPRLEGRQMVMMINPVRH